MDMATLQRHFDDCRLPVEFVNELPPRPRRGRISPLNFNTTPAAPSADDFCYVDVEKQHRTEYFRLYVHPEAEMYLRDKRPPTRHLLLQLRCFPKNEHDAEVRNFLLGHDERQLFVIRPQAADTVQNALESLKPRQVMWAEQRGLKVVRQGDWFFIPLTGRFQLPANGIPANGQPIGGVNARSLGIVVGNPHIAGEQSIVIRRWWNGMQTMQSLFIAVRGKIRHHEHSTIELRGWHQAVQNTAALANSPAIGYYD